MADIAVYHYGTNLLVFDRQLGSSSDNVQPASWPCPHMASNDFLDIFSTLIRAWKKGYRLQRWVVVIIVVTVALAAVVYGLNRLFLHAPDAWAPNIAIGSLIIATVGYFFLRAALDVEEHNEIKERVERAEHAVAEHPLEARPLWDLARTRLELYFERNLSQINTIFWITVIIMFAGFLMISYGIWRAPQDTTFGASIIAAVSGIVTEFIAATFLVIYRSTMAQASEYVATLERINAVGMAIQIADSIGEADSKLQCELRAELAARILPSSSKIDFMRATRARSPAPGKQSDQVSAILD